MEALQSVLARLPQGGRVSPSAVPTQESLERLTKLKVRTLNERQGDLTGYDCQLCRNKGEIWRVRPEGPFKGEIYATECQCMARRRTVKRLKKSGLLDLVARCTFEQWQTAEPWQKEIRDRLRDFLKAERPEGWVFVGGRSGTGKTHICTALCGELIERGYECRYMLWRDEAAKLKAVVNRDAEQYQAGINPLKTVPLLYIDDLFKSGKIRDRANGGYFEPGPTDADQQLVFEILNARYNRSKGVTVISSEMTLLQIAAIDEATASRIREKCGTRIWDLSHCDNWRLK